MASMGGGGSDPYGPSRYDPSSVDRNGNNLRDLVGEDSDSDVEGPEPGGKNNKDPIGMSCRRMLVVVASVGIIAGGAAGIAAIVARAEPGMSSSNTAAAASDQQRLLEIAEEVVSACGDYNELDEDSSDCQRLCNGYMCCFEEEDHRDNCEDDPLKDCAVYAGCRALVEGVPANGASSSVGRRKWGRG